MQPGGFSPTGRESAHFQEIPVLPGVQTHLPLAARSTPVEPGQPDLSTYDRIIVFFSGGKDSQACVLHLIDLGVAPECIELHHHSVDGHEGSTLMDWPVTRSYCEAFARAFGLPIIFSWKVGGFEGEMLRDKARTAPIAFQSETGQVVSTGGDRGKLGTRLRFPQVSPDLRVRWCSAYLKIDVGARVLTHEPRFQLGRTLVVTGERAEESSARARYAHFEPHRADKRAGRRPRHIDHWRPVHAWDEARVWAILERYRVNPHPAYWLGWGRTSCRACIFGSANQWATLRAFMPEAFGPIARHEEAFGVTIQRNRSVVEAADRGSPYPCNPIWLAIANSHAYRSAIRLPAGQWRLPPGAFGEAAGPT